MQQTCSVADCLNLRVSHSLCPKHRYRMKRYGSLDLPPRPTTRYVSARGYVMVYAPRHPMANSAQVVFEHRLVMSQHIGRNLLPHENVHHINGDKLDNRIENLELWTRSQPSGQRVADQVLWAVELLEKYAPHYLAARPNP